MQRSREESGLWRRRGETGLLTTIRELIHGTPKIWDVEQTIEKLCWISKKTKKFEFWFFFVKKQLFEKTSFSRL